jgi:hypothetical protein
MRQEIGRGRLVLGFLAAAMQVLSGAVHSILGWPVLTQAFAATRVPPALVQGLAVPWHFAGLAMVTFGVIVALTLLGAVRRPGESLEPVAVIGIAYLLFGVVGMAVSRGDPSFLIFIVPGVMLLLVAWRSRGRENATVVGCVLFAALLSGCEIREIRYDDARTLARADERSTADSVLGLVDSLVAIHQSRPDTALLLRLFPRADTLLYVEGGRLQHFTGDSLLQRTLHAHAGVRHMAPRASERYIRMLGRDAAELTVVWTVDVLDASGVHHPWAGPLTLGVARNDARWVVRTYRE